VSRPPTARELRVSSLNFCENMDLCDLNVDIQRLRWNEDVFFFLELSQLL
jgi:hypothetical protein